MERLELYKSLHERELDKKVGEVEETSLAVGIATALGTAIFILGTNFEFNTTSFVRYSFSGLVGLSTLTFIGAIIYLARFYSNNRTYLDLPAVKEIDDYLNEYYTCYIKLGVSEQEAKALTKEEEDLFLKELYIEMTDSNVASNNFRRALLIRAKQYTFTAFSLVFLALVPYLMNFFEKAKPIYNIQIVRDSTIADNKNDTMAKQQKPRAGDGTQGDTGRTQADRNTTTGDQKPGFPVRPKPRKYKEDDLKYKKK